MNDLAERSLFRLDKGVNNCSEAASAPGYDEAVRPTWGVLVAHMTDLFFTSSQ
jgi:hypothetical protein